MSPGSSSSEQHLSPPELIRQQESRELYPPLPPQDFDSDDHMSAAGPSGSGGAPVPPENPELKFSFVDYATDIVKYESLKVSE